MTRKCGYFLMVLLSIVTCLLCLVALFTQQQHHKSGVTPHNRRFDGPNSNISLTLNFVPGTSSRFAHCDDLFVGTPLHRYNMSTLYWSQYNKFQAATRKGPGVEGHSGLFATQTKAMHYLASRPSIRHICETGFNMGHSSFNFVTSNPNAIVHSFDLG